MSQLSKEQVQELMKDIQIISTSIKKNQSILQKIMLPRALRSTALLAGLGTIIVCLSFYFLGAHYGSHLTIPVGVRTGLYIFTGLIAVAIGIVKNVSFLRSAREIAPGMSYGQLIRQMHAGWFPQSYIPVVIVLVVLVSAAIAKGEFEYLVPIISISYGLMLNSMGIALRTRPFIASAYWMVAAGLVALFTPDISPLIGLAYSFGGAMLLLWALSFGKAE